MTSRILKMKNHILLKVNAIMGGCSRVKSMIYNCITSFLEIQFIINSSSSSSSSTISSTRRTQVRSLFVLNYGLFNQPLGLF